MATPGRRARRPLRLTALRVALADRPRRIVVVTPTAHLKTQWALAAAELQLHLDPAWSPADGPLAKDMHGVVTTYQQVATYVRQRCGRSRTTRSSSSTRSTTAARSAPGSESLREAFGGAARQLGLSGTPFRSDTRAIPFVRYVADEGVVPAISNTATAEARCRTGRGRARPIYFPAVGGKMEWSAPDGSAVRRVVR